MATIYFITDKGILLIEGNAETVAALKEVGSQIYTAAAHAFDQLKDGADVLQYMQQAVAGMDIPTTILNGTQIVGAAAVNGLTDMLVTGATGNPAWGISTGLYAGWLYEQQLEKLRAQGQLAGAAFYDLTHDSYVPMSDAAHFNALSKNFIKGAMLIGNAINATEQSLISTLQSLFGQAQAQGSPLILDLNGDGIVSTTSLSAGIHFDHDGNGFAELSGWVGKDDGLLVLDKNGNGTIDDGGELFGNNTPLAGGGTAANGFAALADLDANHDGKIDANDAAFASLRVWKDANQDGITDAGELLTLAQAGVQSLATGYTASTTVDANGNAFKQVGSFTKADGTTATMTDVWFAADMARTVDKNPVAESATVAALPDIAGFGNVHGLHQAMARDTTGHLQTLVDQFAGTTDPVARKALVVSIVYAWAGVEGVAPGSRGGAIDAREVAALEAFLGNGYGACAWAVAANDAVFEMRKVG